VFSNINRGHLLLSSREEFWGKGRVKFIWKPNLFYSQIFVLAKGLDFPAKYFLPSPYPSLKNIRLILSSLKFIRLLLEFLEKHQTIIVRGKGRVKNIFRKTQTSPPKTKS
jgi:hypothetical protein